MHLRLHPACCAEPKPRRLSRQGRNHCHSIGSTFGSSRTPWTGHLRYNRAVLDFTTLEMHFLGPGDSKVNQSLPPGTDSFQLEIAPSGHLVLPCSEFQHPPPKDTSLTLLTQTEASSPSGHTTVRPSNAESLPRELTFSPITVHPPKAPLSAPRMMTMGKETVPPPDIHA